MLVPGDVTSRVPTSEAEQPGMGKAVGGVAGGAIENALRHGFSIVVVDDRREERKRATMTLEAAGAQLPADA